MTSIFDLTSPGEVLPKANLSKYRYEQYPATKNIQGTSFPGTVINFKWEQAGNEWFVPGRSYLKGKFKLSLADNVTQLDISQGIAPAMNFMSNLFTSGNFKINNTEISKISDFLPQIDAHHTRTTKSNAFLEGIAKTLNWSESNIYDRLASVCPVVKDTKDGWEILDDAALGFANDDTLEITVTTGAVTFVQVTATMPDVRDIFIIGDILEIDIAAGTQHRYNVTSITDATHIVVDGGLTPKALAAAAYTWRRYRPRKRNVITFEAVWQPPMSVFKLDGALPVGTYQLSMVSQSSDTYKKMAIESLFDKTPGTGNDFNFSVEDMEFYAASMIGPRIENTKYILDLDETDVHDETIGSGSSSQKTFSGLSPATYALSVAFQDSRYLDNTMISASKFKVHGELITKTGRKYIKYDERDQELKLTRLQVNYASQDKPIPEAKPLYNSEEDSLQQRYNDTMMYTSQYFNSGGCESFVDWIERGPYYFFPFPKDGTDKSTIAMIRYGFTNYAGSSDGKVLLFAHKKKVATISVIDSKVRVTSVQDV